MKFMTQVHVFFGFNYYQGEEIFWYTNYTEKLMEIFKPFQQNHLLSIGAHIHHINVVAPQTTAVPDLEIVQVIMPAVSPIYNNMPGFGLLTINENVQVEKFEFVFLQL